VVFGAVGIPADWRELGTLDIERGEAAGLFTQLRARAWLHPALKDVEITHRWADQSA